MGTCVSVGVHYVWLFWVRLVGVLCWGMYVYNYKYTYWICIYIIIQIQGMYLHSLVVTFAITGYGICMCEVTYSSVTPSPAEPRLQGCIEQHCLTHCVASARNVALLRKAS